MSGLPCPVCGLSEEEFGRNWGEPNLKHAIHLLHEERDRAEKAERERDALMREATEIEACFSDLRGMLHGHVSGVSAHPTASQEIEWGEKCASLRRLLESLKGGGK